MFDFPMTKESLGTAIFCLVVYLLILCNNYKRAFKKSGIIYVKRDIKKWNVLIAGIIIVIFCKKGDFFGLMENVHNYNFTSGAFYYGERIYWELGRLLNKNYLLFRFVVWGGAFTLFCYTAKRLKVPVYYSVMLLFCSYIVLFAYGRVTAAMSIYFFGVSFLCQPIKGHKWLSYILGLLIIYTSWEFHNSAIIMIVITFVLLMPIKKWSIALILIGLPLITIVAKEYFYEIALLAEENESAVGERMLRYSQSGRENPISQIIMRTFKYSSFYIPIIISTFVLFVKNKIKETPSSIIKIYKITFGIILTASVIYLFGSSFYVMFYRVLYMAMIPLCLLVTSLYEKKIITLQQFKWCYMPGLINSILDIVYDIYAIYTTI